MFIGICPGVCKISVDNQKPTQFYIKDYLHFTGIPHISESVKNMGQLIDRDCGRLVVPIINSPNRASQQRHVMQAARLSAKYTS